MAEVMVGRFAIGLFVAMDCIECDILNQKIAVSCIVCEVWETP